MKKVKHILIATMFSEPLPLHFSYFSLTARFKDQFDEIFGETEPIPGIPAGHENVPLEIPRYILQTDDSNYNFSFSGIRFDFNFNKITNFEISILDNHLTSIEKVLNAMFLPPFRIGIVLNGVIVPESGIEEFLKDFINSKCLNHSVEYQVSYRDMISHNGHNYNQWIRYGGLRHNNTINFQLDINSVSEIPSNQLSFVYSETIQKKIGDFIGC